MNHHGHRRGFSLVELIVVLMIIGMLASIAIPRFSRGSQGASEGALDANLRLVRQAIILYAAEHNNIFPGPTADRAAAQLTQYTTRTGAVSATKTGAYIYGRYLHQIPPCPVDPNAGSSEILIDQVNSPPNPKESGGEGWVYNPLTGEFIANVETDNEAVALEG